MYPVNQYMDPYYSYCRDHAPYPYYPPPQWESGHQRMAMDSSSRPPIYGPWPYGGSTSHSHPPEFHSCCNHTYPPGYYSFRPPLPEELTPPHLYYHGSFPHHTNVYHPYFVPPPPYPVDQTPHSYDKFKGHCCGCPNHVFHGGERDNLKIDEEMPEVKLESEQKGADNSSIIRHPNYQYPVMWLPPGNMKDKGNGRSFELPPQLLSKWTPESGERTRDAKQQEHDNQKTKQWPIIWMPAGYDKPKQEAKQLKEIDESPKVSEDAPPSPKINIIPLSWFENGHHDQKPATKDGLGEHNERPAAIRQPASTEHRDGTTVDGNFETIPVVPMKHNNETRPVGQNCKTISVVPDKESHEKKVGTCRIIPVMSQKERDEKKSVLSDNKEEKKASNAGNEGENGKRKIVQSLTAKHSKLPPVCLRVDPLARKKSGNSSSRSSSPPTRKDVAKDKDVKEAQSQSKETKLSGPNKESDVSEVKEKSPDETDKRMEPRTVAVQAASVKHAQEEQIPTIMDDQKVQPRSIVEAQENAGAKTLQPCDEITQEDEMKIQGEAANFSRRHQTNFSEPDAAVRIQSAYRGYHVRRWQPLEKLRKIKVVHEQTRDVKKQLQGLEASSRQPTVKEQVAINETIMNLLLNLDTIQGLHPSVREARKSVARELVCLQEKLDSLCKQPSGEPNHSECQDASKEEKYTGVGEDKQPSSINSKELVHDEVSSGVSMELGQDADSTEHKHQMEESSTTKEEAHDEGKAAALGECQGASSVDVMRDAALSGHSTVQKHQMKEASTISREEWPKEEKATAKGERQEVSSLDYMELLHDAALSQEPNVLKQCSASTEHNRHTEESNIGVSPTATEDITTAMATSSMENGMTLDKDGSAEEGQVRESAAVESSELKQDVTPAEEDKCNEPSAPFVPLEDSEIETHEHDLALVDDSIVFNPEDQPEDLVADTTQDSAKEPDGTPEALVGDTNNMDYAIAANADNSAQSPLLEGTSQSGSTLEQIVSEESEATKHSDTSCEDDSALVNQQNEPHVEKPTGSSAIGEEPLAVPLENEAKTMENILNVAGAPSNMVTESTLPGSETSTLPFEHDGTGVHENPDSKVSLDNQSDAQKECANGDKTSGGMDSSEAVECKQMLKEAPVCATGADPSELEIDNTKENVIEQTTSEEGAYVSADIHENMKNDDEKKLTEENQNLKELLQKLLASGDNQMEVIMELGEKVKTLERKLARKRRPKVRLHRPVRNGTAKIY